MPYNRTYMLYGKINFIDYDVHTYTNSYISTYESMNIINNSIKIGKKSILYYPIQPIKKYFSASADHSQRFIIPISLIATFEFIIHIPYHL